MAKAGEKKSRLAKVSDFADLKISWNPSSGLTPETSYIQHASEKRRQHFGQFFTPVPIATMMANWVAAVRPKRVLEPSVGTGALVRAIGDFITDARLTCIDIDRSPMQLAEQSAPVGLKCNYLHADFLLLKLDVNFDGILSNPPYLRHHDIAYEANIYDEIGARNNVSISRACNLYILFLFEICRLLAEGGRAAVLVPADWLNSNAAKCLRDYLLVNRFVKEILYFDERGHHFDGALTTSVVLLLEKNGVSAEEFTVKHYSSELELTEVRPVTWKSLASAKKWNTYLVGKSSQQCDSLIPLASLAKTKRGLATGANEFFHLTDDEVLRAQISTANLLPCIGNAKDVAGLIFRDQDLSQLATSGSRTKLVNFAGELSETEQAYIRHGEQQGFHERFLLARRRPWYKNEKREPAPIWAASFGRDRVRFVWNRSSAVNLTTYHCIYPSNLTEDQLGALVCLLNSMPVQQRFAIHLRILGGGLLKFQPNDLLHIEIPDVRLLTEDQLCTLNSFLVKIDMEMREFGSSSAASTGTMQELNSYVEALLEQRPRTQESKEALSELQFALF